MLKTPLWNLTLFIGWTDHRLFYEIFWTIVNKWQPDPSSSTTYAQLLCKASRTGTRVGKSMNKMTEMSYAHPDVANAVKTHDRRRSTQTRVSKRTFENAVHKSSLKPSLDRRERQFQDYAELIVMLFPLQRGQPTWHMRNIRQALKKTWRAAIGIGIGKIRPWKFLLGQLLKFQSTIYLYHSIINPILHSVL